MTRDAVGTVVAYPLAVCAMLFGAAARLGQTLLERQTRWGIEPAAAPLAQGEEPSDPDDEAALIASQLWWQLDWP